MSMLDQLDLDAGLVGHGLQLAGRVEVAQRGVDLVAPAGEVDGGGPADAGVGAGDDGDTHARDRRRRHGPAPQAQTRAVPTARRVRHPWAILAEIQEPSTSSG